MKTELPDTRSMLPSEARAALTAYLLDQLEESPLGCYAQALGAMRENEDPYAWTVLYDCWQAARAEYDRKHPIK